MFDLNFYLSVLGYTLYHKLLRQDPNKILSKRKGTNRTMLDYVLEVEKKLSIAFKCNFFNYYMKMYFKYFNLNYMKVKSRLVFIYSLTGYSLTVLIYFAGHMGSGRLSPILRSSLKITTRKTYQQSMCITMMLSGL